MGIPRLSAREVQQLKCQKKSPTVTEFSWGTSEVLIVVGDTGFEPVTACL